MAKRKENPESGEGQTQSATDLPKVSVHVEQALVKLYDAAYRIRHIPKVKVALSWSHSGGTMFEEPFVWLVQALDDAKPFVDVLRAEVKDEA